jgi:histidinol-phosphatase (PHP family)
MYLIDYHIHSDNSTDGKNSIYEMCAKAVVSGLNEIAFTDHFEPSLGNEQYSYYDAEKYFFEIFKAESIFASDLKIKRAVELGQPHLYTEYSEKLIEAHSYDYVLASAHKMIDNRDFGEIIYNELNISFYCIRYLQELNAIVDWNKYDCVGHLDLIKRYSSMYNTKAHLMDYKNILENILIKIIQNGKGIEVNTSGLRQFAKECLPGLDIVKFYRQLGGEIITVGSDAHTADDVGKGIKEGIELIEQAGFNYISVYKNRQPAMIKISQKSSHYDCNIRYA